MLMSCDIVLLCDMERKKKLIKFLCLIYSKKKHEKGLTPEKSVRLFTRVEKEFLKPSYTASIGDELEDGLFDGNDYI